MPTDAEVIEQIEQYASWLEGRLGPMEIPADGQMPVSSVVVSMPDRSAVRRRWAAVMAAAVVVAVVAGFAVWSRGPSPRGPDRSGIRALAVAGAD